MEFSSEIDEAVEGILEPRGKKNHYAVKGFDLPLSITKIEGQILFSVVRMFAPRKILEFGTGTGYSTAWLFGGFPRAEIITVDDYSEGGMGERGFLAAKELIRRMGGNRVEIVYDNWGNMEQKCKALSPDFIFADGIISREIATRLDPLPGSVIAAHDVTCGIFMSGACIRLSTESMIGFRVHESDLPMLRRFCSIFARDVTGRDDAAANVFSIPPSTESISPTFAVQETG